MLVEHGLKIMERDKNGGGGAECYLEASWEGEGLYKKHGWKECEELVFDLKEYGVRELPKEGSVIRVRNMMRPKKGL